MKIRPKSEQVQMPLLYFTARINDYGRVLINAIIHDELNKLILTCHVLDSE